jgi:hypothetical protein
MPTSFIAQNGAEIRQSTPIAVRECPAAAEAKKSSRRAKRGEKKG